MSLIFDRFPSRDKAESFVAEIQRKFGLAGLVFDDEESAFEHDPFPYSLEAPIVYIDRPGIDHPDHYEIERAVEARVEAFRGEFAGT
jgi:hypothetical protein